MNIRFTRRRSIKLIGGSAAALLLPSSPIIASEDTNSLKYKFFAGGDKQIPVIGMGTWQTFKGFRGFPRHRLRFAL